MNGSNHSSQRPTNCKVFSPAKHSYSQNDSFSIIAAFLGYCFNRYLPVRIMTGMPKVYTKRAKAQPARCVVEAPQESVEKARANGIWDKFREA